MPGFLFWRHNNRVKSGKIRKMEIPKLLQQVKRPSDKIMALGIAAVLILISLFYYAYNANRAGGSGQSTSSNAKLSVNTTQNSPADPLRAEYGTSTSFNLGNSASAENEEAATSGSNLTENLAEGLMAQYLQVSQAGQTLDNATKNQIVSNLVSATNNAKQDYPEYSESDLNISASDSPTAAKTYGNTLGAILKKYQFNSAQDPATIVNKALQDNSPKEIATLDPVIKNYGEILKEASQMAVPESAVSAHLDFLNALSEETNALQGFRNVFSDPMSAALSIDQYSNAGTSMDTALSELQQYFQNENVFFTPSEYGYVFQ